MPKNRKSMALHHKGAPAQEAEQVCATKINGVAMQCKRHKPLANAPNVSDF